MTTCLRCHNCGFEFAFNEQQKTLQRSKTHLSCPVCGYSLARCDPQVKVVVTPSQRGVKSDMDMSGLEALFG
jgi:DNA-directed RNA polymerase subunit RPC12/RpoP